jgi:hypothetical protein
MNSARILPTSLALLSLGAAALAAHCAQPVQQQTVFRLQDPEAHALGTVTVRRTDTAAPTGEAPAEPAAPTPAADADAGAAAAVTDGSAPTSAAAPPADNAATRAVRATLDAQHAAIARCYDEILSTAPEALGSVNVELAVNGSGVLTRTDVRPEGAGGLPQVRPCIEAALRTLRFSQIPAFGAVIRRTYNFVNPPVEVRLAQPMRVQAPARNARPAEAPQPAAAAAARGVLSEAEVAPQLTLAIPALQACYATTLRRAARAAGDGELRVTVQPNGEVQSSTWRATVEPIALMGDCLETAVRAVRFRNSGTGATIVATLQFAR